MIRQPNLNFKKAKKLRPSWPALLIIALSVLAFLFCDSQPAAAQDAPDGWLETMEPAVKKSAISGKPIFVKFEAEWCGSCNQLNKEFAKPEFKSIKDGVILVRINIDQNPELAQDFDVQSIPNVLLLDSNLEVIEQKIGMADVSEWTAWLKTAVEGTEFEMPDVLVSNEPPTRTEIKELIEQLASRDAAMRQITMQRLIAFPSKTREPLIESLAGKGKLAQKLSIIEVLDRWDAPVDGLDPWVKASFTEDRMALLDKWKAIPVEELQNVLTELSDDDLEQGKSEMESLLKSRNVRAGLARMTRFGPKFLPTVYERIKTAGTDEEFTRLTALRYWLTASNELRLGWASGLIELASTDQASKRNAASALVERATLVDQTLLLELFADSDPLVRELSLKGLNQIGAKETDAILAKLLNDPDPNVRAAVLKQFTESESSSMIKEVAKYLETEKDADLIVHALKYLKSVSSTRAALDPVLQFVEHESWQVRAEVAETLGKIDADDLSSELLIKRGDAVTKLLEDTDGFVVSRALEALPRRKTKKQIENLAEIALRKPEIANEIAASISASRNSSSEKIDGAPFLKKFLMNENVEVRLAGIRGLAEDYADSLTDDELSVALADENKDVRVAALTAFSKHLESYRSFTESLDGRGNAIPSPAPRRSGILGLFGFGGSPRKPKAVEEDDSPPVPRLEPELVLPRLKGESWLKRWIDGKVETKVKNSAGLIAKLVDSDDAEEKFLANYNLVLLGDQEKISTLFELAKEDENLQSSMFQLLEWVPFERRAELFREFLPSADSGEKMQVLIEKLTSIRNPAAAELIWASLENESMPQMTAYEHLLKAYFADSGSTYNSVSDYGVDKGLIKYAVSQTEPYLESKNEKKQMTALMFLNNLDPKIGKKAAIAMAKKAEAINVKDLAFRISLKRDTGGNNYDYSKTPDYSHAVQYLDTQEAWKYKIALRYMAIGPESLNNSDNMPETIYLGSRVYYYGGGRDKVKVKIPKPPKGMTLEDLDRDDLKLDEETTALVTYYRTLLDNKTNIDPVLKYYQSNSDNEGIAKLVYEVIATTNNDIKIPIVEAIYDSHGEYDESFAAHLYWTIRVMDGENATKLRKKIRDAVGMDSLNNY